jgi:phosphonopyruvate decarboxylase
MSGKDFAELLERQGYDFFAGVPCSLIEGVLSVLETHPRLPYVAAVREDVAIGMAAGAWLAGRQPAILMQNSGLGTSLNALASLALMYKFPSLLLVTWRGYAGVDAPEHILMGAISPRLLDLLAIAHRELRAESVEADLHWATQEATRRSEPVALLLPPHVIQHTERGSHTPEPRPPIPNPRTPNLDLAPTISRAEAIRAAVRCLSDEPVIHANGYICRESYAVHDRPLNFYMIGSMGLASSIGLGVALGKPDKKVVVFDGDGNLLMSLGMLPMVGGLRPRNFLHVVFDNEVYGSTGNQLSLSREVRLDRLAAAAGYRSVRAVSEPEAIESAVRDGLAQDGPGFILVKVTAAEEDVPRIPYPPEAIRDRFRTALRSA